MTCLVSGLVLFQVRVLCAGMAYDEASRSLRLVDFPEEAPATLHTLLEADRAHGWNKVAYDAGTDTYRVDASIWIGNRSGYSTFFRIGDREHPRATLVIRGSLWVKPAVPGVPRSDGSPSIMNGLLAGDRDDADIAPTILFDCDTAGQHGIFAGYRQKAADDQSLVHMVNTTCGSLHAGDPVRRWGAGAYMKPGEEDALFTMGCYARSFLLLNCRFTDFQGPIFYGALTATWSHRDRGMVPVPGVHIEGCVFENGGSPLAAHQRFRRCTFRNLMHPVKDNGSVYVRAVNCTFEGNAYNWYTRGFAARDSFYIDCRILPQKRPPLISRNRRARPKVRVPDYPTVRVMKSVRVKVIDGQGQPVPMATVDVAGDGLVFHGGATTGLDGLTGSDPETDAVVVTVRRITATDDPEQPDVKEDFRYRLRVSARGRSAVRTVSVEQLAGPLAVTLE